MASRHGGFCGRPGTWQLVTARNAIARAFDKNPWNIRWRDFRSKLMLGIPFYSREWSIDAAGKLVGTRTLYMKDLPGIIQQQNAAGSFDPVSGQTKYTYMKDGLTYVFWAETANTVKARVALAKKYDLAGIAAWRLGYENADLWTMLLQQK